MNNKFAFSAGILNIVIAGVLVFDAGIIGFIAFACLFLSVTIFFMAAIPAFIVTGILFLLVAGASIANLITGVGSIVASIKNKKASTVFSVISLVVDGLIIPANFFALAFDIYSVLYEMNGLGIFLIIIASLAILLGSASLILNSVALAKRNKTA